MDDNSNIYSTFEFAKQQNETSGPSYFNVSRQLFLPSTCTFIKYKIGLLSKKYDVETSSHGPRCNCISLKNYAKHILNVAHIETRKVKDVTEIIKKIKIYDAILHTKVAWEQVDPQCIIKCFRHSGVLEQESLQSPPSSPVDVSEDGEFANYVRRFGMQGISKST